MSFWLRLTHGPVAYFTWQSGRSLAIMDPSHLDLLVNDELDIALRLSYLKYAAAGVSVAGGAGSDEREARRKDKKAQKDLKV